MIVAVVFVVVVVVHGIVLVVFIGCQIMKGQIHHAPGVGTIHQTGNGDTLWHGMDQHLQQIIVVHHIGRIEIPRNPRFHKTIVIV